MSVCKSCSTIASLTETSILLSGSVPGCGKCQVEEFSREQFPPSHPDLSGFVTLYDREGRRGELVKTMTGVRSEDSALFTLDELEASDGPKRALGRFERRSSEHSLDELLSPPEQRRESLDSILALGSYDMALLAPVEVARPVRARRGEESRALSLTLAGLSILLGFAVAMVVILADERGLLDAAPTERVIVSASAAQKIDAPRELRPMVSLPSMTAIEAETSDGVLRLEPIEIVVDLNRAARPRSAATGGEGRLAAVESGEAELRGEAPAARDDARAVMVTPLREGGDDARQVDSVVTDVLGSPPHAAEETDPELPQTLSRAQVASGLRSVAHLARNCGIDQDTVRVTLTIDGATGQVREASLGGALTETIEGRCVTRAVQRARFPRFDEASLSVASFPLVLR
jgi:hypothetical protein